MTRPVSGPVAPIRCRGSAECSFDARHGGICRERVQVFVNSFRHRRPRRPTTTGAARPPPRPGPISNATRENGFQPEARPEPRPLTQPELLALESSPFTALGLTPALVQATVEEGYTVPTPVQAAVIPHVLAGRDILACAQTGTGKTAAFVLPLIQRLAAGPRTERGIRVLVLTPTRELAAQIADSIKAYGRFVAVRHAVVYGGVSQRPQEEALRHLPEILVATPGRLLDLMRQHVVRLDEVAHLVLDEADRMLDMGFVRDVRAICAAIPAKRETLLFSATMPPEVSGLANALLKNPVRVDVSPAVTTAVTVEQSVVFVAKADKRALLEEMLRDAKVARAIVFMRTKHGANRLSDQLAKSGIEAGAIHGNKSQNARQRALDAFKAGTSRVLVATDVASRGIDVDGISHVINFELPSTPESYVHRIGRTGRAGAVGQAVSFCDPEERGLLADIERLIRCRLTTNPSLSGRPAEGAPRPAVSPEELAPPRPARSQSRYRGASRDFVRGAR
jgi:ATP-dependent RNA helicase RhlE